MKSSRTQIPYLSGKEFVNLVMYTPCCFISNSKFSLKLFGGDVRFSGSHQEYSMKPGTERGIRLVEDCTGSRANLSTAKLARIHLTAFNPVVVCYPFTFLAEDSFRPSGIFKKFKTGIFGRKLLLKIFNRICFHRFISMFNLSLYINICNTCCQGI